MEFDENRPIYLQIADGICEKALSGTFKRSSTSAESATSFPKMP